MTENLFPSTVPKLATTLLVGAFALVCFGYGAAAYWDRKSSQRLRAAVKPETDEDRWMRRVRESQRA